MYLSEVEVGRRQRRPRFISPYLGGTQEGSPVIQRIQDALSSGQWYVALGLAVLAGVRDENRLTSLIFYARHPERRGQRLVPGEPQYAQLSREWLDIRNRLVRPYMERMSSAERAPAAMPSPAPQPAQAVPSDKAAFLERVLRAHIDRSTQKKGAPLPDLRPDQLARVAGTGVEMRSDAAAAAGRLIAAANQDLAAAKAAGDPDAQRTVRISATSGYRGRAHQ